MRFLLDDDQQAVLASVDTVLGRMAGPERVRALGGDAPAYDHELEEALDDAGFLDLYGDKDASPLEAALVVGAVARAAGAVAAGARALVAPAVVRGAVPGPVALTTTGHRGPVRYGFRARTLLVAGPDEATLVFLDEGSARPVEARYGYPFGEVDVRGGTSLGPGSAARMRAWWRVALAVEMVGTMEAALELTLEHLRGREQFGRPLGSFQAVQHRLAECKVAIEGSRWLALEAAWNGAPDEAAAAAVLHAASAARRVHPELHQFTGALGFTTEYDLHLWTMRLPALWLEADWMERPSQALSAARWDAGAA